MDVQAIHFGETGLDQLLQWLQREGQPQTLEALTTQYVTIVQQMIKEREGQQA